ncbi:endonuclease/exonuclease/phosphatase family protein [Ostertagia ostertagi]
MLTENHHKVDPDIARSIVVSGVPESQSPNSVDRAHHDIQCIYSRIECIPSMVFRMGIKNSSRPRLLKVVLPSSRFQIETIKRAPRLRFFSQRGVYIRPSLTKEERERRREARQKNSDRNNNTAVETTQRNNSERAKFDGYHFTGKPPTSPRLEPRIKCILSNIRSLIKNYNSLVLLLLHENYDLVLITETWLTSKHDTTPLLGVVSSQYDVLRCDRLQKRGGGVLALIKNTMSYEIVHKESLNDAFEILIVDLIIRHQTFRLILVYRTPICNTHNCSCCASCSNAPSLIVGDFNLADIDWHVDNQFADCNSISRDFLDMFRSHNFVQFVKNPSRGDSYLDLVLCNDDHLIHRLEMQAPIGNSDHASIIFDLNVSSLNVAPRRWIRDFNKANYGAIGNYLSDIDWVGSFATVNSIEEKYELFITILNDAISIFVPLVHASKNVRYKIPRYLERMICQRSRLWKNAVSGDCDASWDEYKTFDMKLNKCMTKYNAYLERKITESTDPTKLFTYITKRLKDTKKIPALRIDETTLAILDGDKAEVLAESFQKRLIMRRGADEEKKKPSETQKQCTTRCVR